MGNIVEADGSINHDNLETIGMRKMFGIKERPKDELLLLKKTESLNLNGSQVVKRKIDEDSEDKTGAGDNGKENRISKRLKNPDQPKILMLKICYLVVKLNHLILL